MAELDNLTIKVTADTKEAVQSLKQFARSVQTQYTKISSATGDNKKLNKQLSKMFSFDKKSIGNEVKKAKETMQGELDKGNGLNFQNVTNDYLKNIKDISPSVVSALKDLSEGFNNTIPAMKDFNSEALDVIKKLQKISDLSKSYASNINKSATAFRSLNKQKDTYNKPSEDFLAQVGVKANEVTEYANKTSQELMGTENELEKQTKQSSDYIVTNMGRIKTAFVGAFKQNINTEGFKTKLKEVTSVIENLYSKGLKKLTSGFKHLAKSFALAITPINAIKPAIEGLKQKIYDFERSISRIYKMLRLMILRKILQAGIRGAIDGFKNLVQYSERTNASVSQLYSSLTELKNALASMLTPLINASANFQGLASVLNTVIQKLISIVNAINQTLSALVGNNKWIKAKKLNLDYASSLDKTSKSAKELNRQLQSIDELNVLNSDNDSGSDDSGVSPTDMFEEADIEQRWKDLAEWLKSMWETGDFTELGSAIGNWLKNALESIPWEKVQRVAEKVGKSFATLLNGFVEVEGLAFTIGKTLAEGFNTIISALHGFVKNLNGISVGKFIAEFFNGILESIQWDKVYDTFVTGAKKLADIINGFDKNFDWSNLSTTLFQYVRTISNTIYTFFSEVDWESLGKHIGGQIHDAIKLINWEDVGKAFGSIIQSIITFISSVIKELDMKDVISAIQEFFKGVAEECDLTEVVLILVGLFNAKLALKIGGIVSSVTVNALTGALKDLIVKSFAKKAVGEAVGKGLSGAVSSEAGTITAGLGTSLSTILGGAIGIAVASVGGYIIGKNLGEVLFTTLGDYESADAYKNFNFGDFFEALNFEDAFGAFNEFYRDIKDKMNEIVGSFKDGTWKDDITDGLNAIFVEPFDVIKLMLADAFGEDSAFYKMSDWLLSLQQELLDFPLDVWEGIRGSIDATKTAVSTFASEVSENWDSVVSKLGSGDIDGALSSIKEIFTTTFDNVLEVLGIDKDGIIDKYEELVETFSDNALINAVQDVCDSVSIFFDDLKTNITSIIDDIVDYVSTKCKDIIDKANDAKDALSNGTWWGGISAKSGGLFKFGGFASGGFPNEGQLFLANESGAEMVGSFDGKTAVANNQMIVEGIKQGVYEAMTTQNNILYTQMEYLADIANKEFGISGSDIFSSVQSSAQSYTNRTGRSAFA